MKEEEGDRERGNDLREKQRERERERENRGREEEKHVKSESNLTNKLTIMGGKNTHKKKWTVSTNEG